MSETMAKLDFALLQNAVARQFEAMKGKRLFEVAVDKDTLWNTYINAFPPGTNPVYRERTDHDCSCCKSFVRTMGNIVAIEDNRIVTIWDTIPDDPSYRIVAGKMADLVRNSSIENIFLHTEPSVGAERNFEQIAEGVKTWTHFHLRLPTPVIRRGDAIGPELSNTRSTRDVFQRALNEITRDSIDTTLELINQNSLYRGEEHKFVVTTFSKAKRDYDKLPTQDMRARELFVWSSMFDLAGSVTHVRNSSIGTLLVDLSKGLELEEAVRKYEAVVAPANYKRPTALVTKAMVDRAKATIAELGLTSALERRYAKLTDITINNVLFADRSAQKSIIGGDVFDDIATKSSSKPRNLDKVEEVTIEKFLADIVPTATSIELFVENKHNTHLVSLIAPVDPGAGGLFKWDNNFSWSYTGDMADSIKDRVKKAGGNVIGDLCCRLAWHNGDDLDLHLMTPDGHISFINRRVGGGQLDVDMNAGGPNNKIDPVENIYYEKRSTMREGHYKLYVNQYSQRSATNPGFEVELDFMGDVHTFIYDRIVKANVQVVEFDYTHKGGLVITQSMPSTFSSQDMWGVKTQEFQRINALMMSPNYWDERGVGNKHYFFMLDGCVNDGSARGFFNEFLKEELTPHRKVIEIVGSKMKTEESADQLSGLGFSSTQRNELTVRVTGAFTRIIKVVI